MTFTEIDQAEEMKKVGINTIAFSPSLLYNNGGKVIEEPQEESFTKDIINKIHQAGIRVMFDIKPINIEITDKVNINIETFQADMTEIIIKYAEIAEEYNVEFFAPISEPAQYMTITEADQWLQELLPKIKEAYKGPIIWKLQSEDLTKAKEWDQDHTIKMKYKLDSERFQIDFKKTNEQKISLGIRSNKVSLGKHSGGTEVFDEKKNVTLEKSDWHDLRIEIIGKSIKIYIDDELMFEYNDEIGPAGTLSISSEGFRFNQFEITDTTGNILLKNDFKNLNNWNAQKGWKIENEEIIVTENTESKLVYDINFKGFDYIAIDTLKRGQIKTNQEYIDDLKNIIQRTNDQAKTDGVQYVILGGFGGTTTEEMGWTDPNTSPLTEEELAEVTQMVLELAESTVDGYLYNGWDIEGQGINKLPQVKEVIKNWYNSH